MIGDLIKHKKHQKASMIYENPQQFNAVLPPHEGRLLALDIGEKRIGLATCDNTRTIASPFDCYTRINTRKDIGYLRRICNQEEIVGIVCGLPVELSGTEGANCALIRKFLNKLLEKVFLPALLYDERMSTAAVTRTMKEAGVKRKNRHKHDDALAACYILQNVLDIDP